MTSASVVLINRNGGRWLSEALESLRIDLDELSRQRGDFELLVVDNASTDDSLDRVDRALSGAAFCWRLVQEPVAGVNSSRNAGLHAASGELIIFVDNDVSFSRGWLAAYLKAAEEHPHQEVFAGRVFVGKIESAVPAWLDLTGKYARPSIVVQADYGNECRVMAFAGGKGPVGPNMAMRRSLFDRIGPFDTRFGLRPGSLIPGAEAEFFRRLDGAGMSFVYVPEATVHHPLKRSQISRRYFLKRLYGIGRAHGRMQRARGERCTRVCGVARYVLGNLCLATRDWLASWFSGDAQQRFYYCGNLAMHLGHLHEEVQAAMFAKRTGDGPSGITASYEAAEQISLNS